MERMFIVSEPSSKKGDDSVNSFKTRVTFRSFRTSQSFQHSKSFLHWREPYLSGSRTSSFLKSEFGKKVFTSSKSAYSYSVSESICPSEVLDSKERRPVTLEHFLDLRIWQKCRLILIAPFSRPGVSASGARQFERLCTV